MPPAPTEPDYVMRVPIRASPIRTETCICQCPRSGSISIYYDGSQPSCSVPLTRKRRDHHRKNNEVDDYLNSII